MLIFAPETINVSPINKTIMTVKESWKPVTVGGFTGILMGAGAMYAMRATATSEEASVEQLETIKEAQSNDNLSFREAFEAARAEVGPGGVFRWHGNIYNTYTAEEWKAMSENDKLAFAEKVRPEVSAEEINTNQIADSSYAQVTENQQEVTVGQDDDVQVASTQEATDEASTVKTSDQSVESNDDDVRVVGFGHVQLPDGHYVAVEELDFNGQRVAVIDVDNDGVGDIAMSDFNHNQQADEGEIIDLHTGEALAFTNSVDDDMMYASDENETANVEDTDTSTLL